MSGCVNTTFGKGEIQYHTSGQIGDLAGLSIFPSARIPLFRDIVPCGFFDGTGMSIQP